MTRKTMALASALLVLAFLLIGIAVAMRLPEGTQLPIHWGLDGEPDRLADRWTALMFPPAIATAVSLLFYALPALEPKEQSLVRSQSLYLWGWAALLLVMAAIELALLSSALDWGLRTDRLVVGGIGVMFVMIGNQLGKSRRMYMIGLRTPWTLASEEVWIKTHRLGGKLMVAGGLVILLAALLPLSAGARAAVLIGTIAVAAIVPILYSYLLWRQERASGHLSE